MVALHIYNNSYTDQEKGYIVVVTDMLRKRNFLHVLHE